MQPKSQQTVITEIRHCIHNGESSLCPHCCRSPSNLKCPLWVNSSHRNIYTSHPNSRTNPASLLNITAAPFNRFSAVSQFLDRYIV